MNKKLKNEIKKRKQREVDENVAPNQHQKITAAHPSQERKEEPIVKRQHTLKHVAGFNTFEEKLDSKLKKI